LFISNTSYKHSPIPKNLNTLQFYIRRDRVGFTKKHYPCYELYLTEGDVFVMLGKRMNLKAPLKYLITLENELIDKLSPGYLGKLKSNETGNEYELLVKDNSESIQFASVLHQGLIQEGTAKKIKAAIPKLLKEDSGCVWKSTKVGVCH